MKRCILLLPIVLCLCLPEIRSQDAPIATVATTECFSTQAEVLITADNINNLGACNLRLVYDASVATATAVIKSAEMPGFFNYNVSQSGIVILGWYNSAGLTLPDGSTLFTIAFEKVSNGVTPIEWNDDGYSCAWSEAGTYIYFNDVPTEDFYISGSLAFLESTQWTGSVNDQWPEAGNWTNGIPSTFVDALIPAVAPLSCPVINATAACGRLEINTGSQLEVLATGSLTLGGAFTNDGQLIIRSSLASDGSFIDNGSLTGTGSCLVERYLQENSWHYISAPTVDALSGIYSMIFLKDFSEETGLWNYIVSTTEPLIPMKGYAAWASSDYTGSTTVMYAGNLHSGDFSIALTRHEDASHKHRGYNFVGNPYPSAIDWDMDAGWEKVNIENAIWLWNPTAGNYGTYVYMNPLGGTLGVDNTIPSGQGFFVCVGEGYATGQLGVNNAARVHNDKPFFKSSPSSEVTGLILKVMAQRTSYADETIIQFRAGATSQFDPACDAQKLLGLNEAPRLYTISSDSKNLAVNVLSSPTGNTSLPLNFEAGMEDVYTIGAAGIFGLETGMQWILEDKKAKVFVDLSTDDYSFFANTTGETDRFVLHFVVSAVSQKNFKKSSAVIIYSQQDHIVILDPDRDKLEGRLAVYDLSGRCVDRSTVASTFEFSHKIDQHGLFLVVYTCAISQQLVCQKVFIP